MIWFVQNLGSTKTDDNGFYSITFNSVKNRNIYVLKFEIDNRYSASPGVSPGIPDISGWDAEIKNIGNAVNFNFDFWKYYYLKFSLAVHNNPHPPLLINGYYLDNNGMHLVSAPSVYLANNDATRIVHVTNNKINYLKFMIRDDNGNVLKNDQDIPVEVYTDKDTVEFNDKINLYPGEFKIYIGSWYIP